MSNCQVIGLIENEKNFFMKFMNSVEVELKFVGLYLSY